MILTPFDSDRFTLDEPGRTLAAGGIFRFLLVLFGFSGGTMDPNGHQ
jgi:hypothetical protein